MKVLFAFLLVSLGCASSGGSAMSALDIAHFSPAPSSLPTDGGTVTFSWDVSNATSLTIDHGVRAVSPVASGTMEATVAATTCLRSWPWARDTSTATANVTVACNPSPGTLSATCNVPSAGQCVDFSQLSSVDLASLPAECAGFGGQFGSAPVPPHPASGPAMCPRQVRTPASTALPMASLSNTTTRPSTRWRPPRRPALLCRAPSSHLGSPASSDVQGTTPELQRASLVVHPVG